MCTLYYNAEYLADVIIGKSRYMPSHFTPNDYIWFIALVIVKERHETIMGYKPRERVALEWFIPIIVELLVL